MQMKYARRGAIMALVAATAIWSGCSAKKTEPMKTVAVGDGVIDPAEWSRVYAAL